MNQYIPPSPALTVSPVEGGDKSPVHWESKPQLFTDDTTFWQGVEAFICPQMPFDYRSYGFACTIPNENAFKMDESIKSSRSRVKGQPEELLLVFSTPDVFFIAKPSISISQIASATPQKRRAQNHASQRAYRERRDQHVRELETQFEELTREYEAPRCAHEKLKAEQEQCEAASHKHSGVSDVKVVVCKRCGNWNT
jgi:hypothetical protein